MKKKLLSLFLVVAMLASMLVACGNTQGTSGGDGTDKSEIKLADVKPTLKVLGTSTNSQLNDTVEAKVIEEATGYHVEYHGLPADNATQALMLTMANENDYDLVTINSRANFSTLMSNGALLPLNDYIDAIAPELWDCIPEEAWAGVSDEEGNVYAFPKLYAVDTEVASFMTVRMDLCQKAGITELPTTLSGFKDMLYKLKEHYGDKYIILTGPYNRASTGNTMDIPMCISSAFGIYNDWMVDKDGNVIYMTEHEKFDDMINFMNQLYKDGILDVDYAGNSFNAVDEKFASGKAIIEVNSRETINNVFATLEESGVTVDDLGWIGALHGDDGTCAYMETAQYSNYSAIPKKHADNAADTVNWMAEKVKNQELINIGEEGVHFEWGEDGYPIPIQPAFTDERNNANKLSYLLDIETYKVQFAARLRKTEVMWRAYSECTLKANENEPEIFVPAYFAYTTSASYAENNSALLAGLNDYLSQLVIGVKKLDSKDTFMSDFKSLEGETVRSELQTWYDENYK